MHVARDLSEGNIWSALGLEQTRAAVARTRAIENGPVIVHPPSGCQEFALGRL
jgi:hypothetical protein